MFGLKRPTFRSRKDAYGTFFSYFTVPCLIVGLGLVGVIKSRNFGLLSYEQAEQSIYFAIVVSAMVVIYSWYKAFIAFLAIMEDDLANTPETVICLNCQEPYSFETVKGFECPKCSGVLEDLKGFYDRHQELRK